MQIVERGDLEIEGLFNGAPARQYSVEINSAHRDTATEDCRPHWSDESTYSLIDILTIGDPAGLKAVPAFVV